MLRSGRPTALPTRNTAAPSPTPRPGTPAWRLATLPEVPTEVEIEQLLRSFDQPFSSSRRANAMLRCLADLGLRSSEVVGLRLDDIDWQAGTVLLAKAKSRRIDMDFPGFSGELFALPVGWPGMSTHTSSD